jgi:hypothetical protein
MFSEAGDLGGGGFQPEGGQQFQAQPLVFNRVAEVDLQVADDTERKLEDVRGRRGADGTAPTIFVAEERGFLLGAGEGDAEVFVSRFGPTRVRRRVRR